MEKPSPQAWRLAEKQAQPSVWVSCKLTPVFCAPVRSSVSLGAVNICPSPRAGQLWRLQLTDRPEAREGVKGGNFQAPCAGMEERVGEGKWGEHSRHRSLGPPWANMLPSLTGHLEQAARVAAAGSTPLTRRQKHPAVAVTVLLAGKLAVLKWGGGGCDP